MNYLNFYSLFRERDTKKLKALSSGRIFNDDKSTYNFLFIVEGKILMINRNPFFFSSKKISKEFYKFSLSFISSLKNNIFILCHSSNTKIKKKGIFKNCTSFNIRDALFNMQQDVASIISAGYSLYKWQENNKFCGHCGSKNKLDDNGHSLVCVRSSCKKKIFPTVYPTVIVNIINKNKILLARNSMWQKNLYSCLAGFCEQNESAEETVHREVYEEVGLKLKKIRYRYSQYWPYSSNLMLGFEAKVDNENNKIRVNKKEIEKARWFSSNEIITLLEKKKIFLPKKEAIAYSLIKDWLKKN